MKKIIFWILFPILVVLVIAIVASPLQVDGFEDYPSLEYLNSDELMRLDYQMTGSEEESLCDSVVRLSGGQATLNSSSDDYEKSYRHGSRDAVEHGRYVPDGEDDDYDPHYDPGYVNGYEDAHADDFWSDSEIDY